MKRYELICDEDGARLDAWVAVNVAGVSRSYAQKLIGEDSIKINGRSAKQGRKLKSGDRVEVVVPDPTTSEVKPEKISLDVIFEDSDIIVINKPKGMVVHPAAGHHTGTLVNALMSYCGDELSDINGVVRPGIVHRIDRDTSGLIIVAKNNFAHNKLAALLKTHDIQRTYIALTEGVIRTPAGVVDAPIGRNPNDRKKMAVVAEGGRSAVTHFKVLANFLEATYVELRLETGRTHQIRVHMAYIGHPVVGDELYGRKHGQPGLETSGQLLHARRLSFVHPRTGQDMDFDTGIPEYFKKALEYFT